MDLIRPDDDLAEKIVFGLKLSEEEKNKYKCKKVVLRYTSHFHHNLPSSRCLNVFQIF